MCHKVFPLRSGGIPNMRRKSAREYFSAGGGPESAVERIWHRANMAHKRQSRPNSGLKLSHCFGEKNVTCSLFAWVDYRTRGASQRESSSRRGGVRNRLSSEYGTHKTVKARFWPWLEPFFRQKNLTLCKLFPLRSGGLPNMRRESARE